MRVDPSSAPRRAGAYAREQAWNRYRELLGLLWWRVLLFAVPWYAVVIALHEWVLHYSDVLFGVILMIPPWALSVILVSDTGAAAWSIGADGEEWTSAALRKALGREYVIVNDLQFDHWNIDHVVIGPGGLFAVETKWSSDPWISYGGNGQLRRASKQARDHARQLERRLKADGITTPVQPMVVLWGGRTRAWAVETRVRAVEKVPVVAGIGLDQWASGLTTNTMASTERDRVAQWLQAAG